MEKINCKDIKIGNYFKVHNTIVVIHSITENYVTYFLHKDFRKVKDYFTTKIEDLKPLIIDNLLLFGFGESIYKNQYEYKSSNYILKKEQSYFELYFLDSFIKRINFVHELQNLYYLLDKEDLKFQTNEE